MVKSSENWSSTNSAGWRETIDGWIRDPAIRRDSLIALAMILVSATFIVSLAMILVPATFIVSLATGALGVAATSLLPSLLAKTIAGVSALGTSGAGWWLLRRRQHRLAAAALSNGATTSTHNTPPVSSYQAS